MLRVAQRSTRQKLRLALMLMSIGLCFSIEASASVSFTYDSQGRVRTAIYDNGLCIAYSYDAAGNRTSQTNTISGAPTTSVWGSGVWGCFPWSP